MNRIDTETGYIYLGEVVITPDKKIDDYKEYEKTGLVKFINEIDGIAVIVVNGMTDSNEINTYVVINVNEILGCIIIKVTPININTKKIIASKKWLVGMMENCNIDESEDSFSVDYSWGYVSADYGYDPHNGIIGGDIIIRYN